MIQPDHILQKAHNLYPDLLRAWLRGETFFPRIIPAQRDPGRDLPKAIELVQTLRASSKEVVGFGYSVQWKEVRSRTHGKNLFPARVLFENETDFLRFIQKEREFASFKRAVERLRETLPGLEPWLQRNVQTIPSLRAELEGLVEVVTHLRQHPRPGCFARELPLAVDTKFVERNARILRAWLDLALPPHTIRADEDHFERRFGLKYIEPDIFIRSLDSGLQEELGFPCPALSLALGDAAGLPVHDTRVVIVENRVNLMTLPLLQRTLGMGGMGNGVTLLRYLGWLSRCEVTYWGDLDVEGFEILSRLRAHHPHVRSLLMDEAALTRYRTLARKRTKRRTAVQTPPNLTVEEEAAFRVCASENVRIEQERIVQDEVIAAFSGSLQLSGSAAPNGRVAPTHNASEPTQLA